MASPSRQARAVQSLLLLLPCALVSAAVATAAYRRGLARGADGAGGSRDKDGRAVYVPGGIGAMDEEEAAESVLSMWFDGSTADNHRTKWFAQVCLDRSSRAEQAPAQRHVGCVQTAVVAQIFLNALLRCARTATDGIRT